MEQFVASQTLELIESQQISLGKGAKILSVMEYNNTTVEVFALTNTGSPMEKRTIEMAPTNRPLKQLPATQTRLYIGSARVYSMDWHVFEIISM